MQKVSPCLWFGGEAAEAAAFYVSLFRNSSIVSTTHYPEGSPRPAGSVMTVRFTLDGEEYVALNGGSHFRFSPAISLIAYCETQDEVDELWRTISEGGKEGQCGWLTDKYGVSWQVVPRALLEMFNAGDAAASQRAMSAMLQMTKLDLAAVRKAYEDA